MTESRQQFIELLALSGAVQFGDFTAKSGRKTPYFINTGKLMYGDQLDLVGKMYAGAYAEHIGKEDRLLYGPAYKGITLVAVTAAALSAQHGLRVPVYFNRKEKKDHGEGGIFVGKVPEDGDRIVIVEDVITAGTAIRESMDLLKAHGKGTVEAVIIAVDRMERGKGTESSLAELEREEAEALGIRIGHVFGARWKSWSERIGGIILILIGLNDLIFEHLDRAGRYVDRIIALRDEYFPETRLFFLSLTPVTAKRTQKQRDEIAAYNIWLEEKCGQADAEYMDVTAGLTDANGCLPREITTDNDSHLNAEGFGIFVRNMLDYAQARYEEGLWVPDRALTEKEDLV